MHMLKNRELVLTRIVLREATRSYYKQDFRDPLTIMQYIITNKIIIHWKKTRVILKCYTTWNQTEFKLFELKNNKVSMWVIIYNMIFRFQQNVAWVFFGLYYWCLYIYKYINDYIICKISRPKLDYAKDTPLFYSFLKD